MNTINFGLPDSGNFLVKIIAWLVQSTSSVALGVILFTLILKLITLPFDYISRSSMRKNSVRMEKMRPELEKLQKQYAGNKDLYNRKMMALYKKNGYSMWGACLPTIITLIIFIVAINAFSSYSNYQNLKYFYDMSISYNNVLSAGLDVDGEYIKLNENGEIIINKEYFENTASPVKLTSEKDGYEFEVFVEKDGINTVIFTTNSYVKYHYGKPKAPYIVREENLTADNPLVSEKNNYLKVNGTDDYNTYKTNNPDKTATDFLTEIQSEKSAETFRENGASFLWVKNIWVTDSPFKHPVESSWSSFSSEFKYSSLCKGGTCDETYYNSLISKLDKEQSQANGYFILIALTILSSLASQLILGKSQKAQMELQTVDGQGAQQQKIMMWMMPIMMAIFAFMYTAAFSIYIVLNSVLGILTTLGINFIVDRKFKKEEAMAEKEVIRSKVRVIKEQPKKEEPKKKEVEQVDFLSGLADKKKKRKK